MTGKSVNVFMIEGTPNRSLYCGESNVNGRVYRIPRNEVEKMSKRSELKTPGVYVLLGKDDEGQLLAYIGESEDVSTRLQQHTAAKTFWTEALVFIRLGCALHRAHVKYLEHRFLEIAKDIGRCILQNISNPGGATLSEADKSDMEAFIDNTKMLLSTLGVKLFEPVVQKINDTDNTDSEEDMIFIIASKNGGDAKGIRTADGFVVLKGSHITETEADSIPNNVKNIRKSLISEGVITENKFTKDFLFSSASAAAGVVTGYSINGKTAWKTKDGKTLKAILQSNITDEVEN